MRATHFLIGLSIVSFVIGLAIWRRSISGPGKTPKNSPAVLVTFGGRTMGATYSVRYLPNRVRVVSAKEIQSLVQSELERVDGQLSTWRSDSVIARFNAVDDGQWYAVHSDTVQLVNAANELTQLSSGKFDITVAPLINLWGFGPAGPIDKLPSDARITQELEHVGMSKLQWRHEPPALRKLDPHVAVDFAAMGAGYAADCLSHALEEQHVNDFYVDVAGEIVARGLGPTGQPWRVAIAEPSLEAGATLATLTLKDRAIATSGNYRNYLTIDGQKYGHTLDATTGRPVLTDVVSATVVADRCSQADAIATALMTMTAAQGLQLANDNQWSVYLVVQSAGGQYSLQRSKATCLDDTVQ